MSALPKRYFTVEEYFLLEEHAPYKSQYIHGEIFPMGEGIGNPPSMMAGAAPDHVLIASNVNLSLGSQFRGRPCRVFNADLSVAAAPGSMYTYPDVVALCGEPRYETTHSPASLLNPQLIVEVLSPSTEAFDRGEKFLYYQRIVSLTDYVLIAADRMRVEHYTLQEGGWVPAGYSRPDDRLTLASLGCELRLSDIYDKVGLPTPRSVLPGGPATDQSPVTRTR